MKKIFLVVIAVFITTSVMAEVSKSAMKNYVGLGFNSQPISYKTSARTDSGSGLGSMFNGGVILNDKARINFYRTMSDIAQNVTDSGVTTADADFWNVTSIGISYDYLLGDKKHQGWFVGGGIVKTTIKQNHTFKDGVTWKGSASSTSLLLRGGYVHSYSDTLFLLVHGNYDAGKPKIDSVQSSPSVTTKYNVSTGLNFGVSLNYIF